MDNKNLIGAVALAASATSFHEHSGRPFRSGDAAWGCGLIEAAGLPTNGPDEYRA